MPMLAMNGISFALRGDSAALLCVPQLQRLCEAQHDLQEGRARLQLCR